MSNLNPTFGKNQNPLVSVFIHTRKFAPHLRRCLDSVYAQTYSNIEIVFFDTSALDDAWTIALEYAARYPGTMTLGRNRFDFEEDRNRVEDENKVSSDFRTVAKGINIIDLHPDDQLNPEYVQEFVKEERRGFRNTVRPLVSVFIYNHNYGRYLRQCLDSVFAQTYENIEVLFSDNDSSDDSWNIACEYAGKFPGKITIMRNRQNFGAQGNSENCYRMAKGKYFNLLCSDDAMLPEFIERCVLGMESNPQAKFSMAHRQIMDEHGNITEEPSFYNQSCIIPGAEQAAVYMLAAVNPSISQVIYNRELAYGHSPSRGLIERWLSYRLLDFNLCAKSDLLYIKEPLLRHRMHRASDTSAIDHNLMEIFTQYVFVHQCAEIAEINQFRKAADRLPQAVSKIGYLCLRYCVKMLGENDAGAALKYFYLSRVLTPEIYETENYQALEKLWQSGSRESKKILDSLTAAEGLVSRTISYDAPFGSVPIDLQRTYPRRLS